MGWGPQDRRNQLDRLRHVVAEQLSPAVWGASSPLDVTAFHVPGEPVPFPTDAVFTPFAVGDRWGPRWGTTWFRMQGQVPADWAADPEVVARVDLGRGGSTGFSYEGLVWVNGEPRQGLSPNHTFVRVTDPTVDFLVEAASNPTSDGSLLLADPGGSPIGVLARASLDIRYSSMAAILADVGMLRSMVEQLPTDDRRGAAILLALGRFCAALDPSDIRGSAVAARSQLATVLDQPATASAHRVAAVGHAHLDSAWLWPVRETKRKAARSFSNAVTLMDEYPDYRFACSQAQQHAWIKELYPALWERMRKKVADGQFEPVGSMWVEPDCNVPSGESLARQLLFGKRFFMQEYGVETRDVWLPDVFGYSAALPQLMKLAGVDFFLTQKISWSDTNTFPHHTFWWEGIDGSRVFCHFPPADTYNGDVSVRELLYLNRNFKDHDRATMSLYPIGFGDGGGGPTREHIERVRRTGDLEGLPRVSFSTVRDFFPAALRDADDVATWVGELYLEYHRGTYTTQARTKRGNRLGERFLRDAELWSSLSDLDDYPIEQINESWRTLLLDQFHDILPGSSIHWVYEDAEADYARILASCSSIIDPRLSSIASTVDTGSLSQPAVVFNSLGHDRDEVITVDGTSHRVRVPPFGYAAIDLAVPLVSSVLGAADSMENEHLRISWDVDGLLTSIWDKDASREVLRPGERGNQFQLFEDRPNNYDAWDLDRFYLESRSDVTAVDSLVSIGPGALQIVRSFGASTVTQVMRLQPGSRRLDFETEIDWHERHRLLKVAFPLDIHAARATYEIQFGHVERPTHANTSWDWARFEVCAHTWADLSEPDYGAALLNDCKYGYDTLGGCLRLSLLRSPTNPDPEADQGHHQFTYALYPHVGDFRTSGVITAAHALNNPLRVVVGPGSGARPASGSLLGISAPGVIATAVKRGEDEAALVIRLYEAYGQRQSAVVSVGRPIASAAIVDILERDLSSLDFTGDSVELSFRPFEIKTIRLRF